MLFNVSSAGFQYYTMKRYPCTFCEKDFSTRQRMDRHILIHTGQKPHECDVCGKRFRQKEHMTRHKRTMHNPAPDSGLTVNYRTDVIHLPRRDFMHPTEYN